MHWNCGRPSMWLELQRLTLSLRTSTALEGPSLGLDVLAVLIEWTPEVMVTRSANMSKRLAHTLAAFLLRTTRTMRARVSTMCALMHAGP
jgi:hypothetical protein